MPAHADTHTSSQAGDTQNATPVVLSGDRRQGGCHVASSPLLAMRCESRVRDEQILVINVMLTHEKEKKMASEMRSAIKEIE